MLIQQMFKQTLAKLEKAQVAAVSPMDDSYPVILLGHGTEKHDPDVRQAGSDHQPRQLQRVGQMALVQVKATALLVGEEGFNGKPLGIPEAGSRHQIQFVTI